MGLGLRLLLAYFSDGLWYDVTLFKVWSNRLANDGLAGFYEPTDNYVVDYPPGYLYVLMVLGKASSVLFGHGPSVFLLKLPAIAADMTLAAIAMVIAPRVAVGSPRRGLPARVVAGAAILLNPAVILVSAVWGQVDAVMAVLVLTSVWLLTGPASTAREVGAIVLLAITVATKPQGVFALPVVAVFLLWRHGIQWRALGRTAAFAVAGILVIAAMFVPFGVPPWNIPAIYREAGSLYQLTSLWAFNLWGAVGFYRPDTGAGAMAPFGIEAVYVGLVLFAVMAVFVMRRCWRSLTEGHPPTAAVLFGAAAMTCVAFALLTRVHERYLYLAVAALAPFAANPRLRLALLALTVCSVLNVHFVYVMHSHASVPPGDAWTIGPLYDALFGSSRDAVQRKILSVVTAAVCLWTAVSGWRSLAAGALRPGTAPDLTTPVVRQPSLQTR